MVVQAVPSGEVWIVYALPYAASQVSLTSLIVAVAPRSTRSHCGSEPSLLAHRVLVSPSNAALAGSDEDSTDEAVAVLPWESRVAPGGGGGGVPPVPVTVTLYVAVWLV